MRTLLAQAGLSPGETEVARLAGHLPSHRESIEMLYAADGASGDVYPAVGFSAEVEPD